MGKSHFHVSRRAFNTAALAALAVRGMAHESFASGQKSRQSGADLYLNRLTFGANSTSRAKFEKVGREAWIAAELAKPIEDAAISARISSAKLLIEYDAGRDDSKHSWPARKEVAPLNFVNAHGGALLPLIDYEKHGMHYEERIRPAREVQLTALIRATHADAQLREMTTQFWHDHFSVNAMRDERTAAFFGNYDDMLRKNAFGNFRELLGLVARSPSMLFYLNNEASRASPANENFARELFELHTLGAEAYLNDQTTSWRDVPGAASGLAEGYIDQDVYEAARALTGWSVGDGRYVADGENAPMTGIFNYVDRWHDPYQKRVLGVEFRANAGPMQDGELVLNLVAYHKATAKFICTKLCRRFVNDEPPPDLVELAVACWMQNQKAPDQIGQTISAIALSRQFTEQEPRKLKRPFEFMVSFYRALEAEVMPENLDYLGMLSRAGWSQHEFRPPTGHPDHSDHWSNTGSLSAMVDFAMKGLADWVKIGTFNIEDLAAPGEVPLVAALQNTHQRFTGNRLDQKEAEDIIKIIAGDTAAKLSENSDERSYWLQGVVAFVALRPLFMYR